MCTWVLKAQAEKGEDSPDLSRDNLESESLYEG